LLNESTTAETRNTQQPKELKRHLSFRDVFFLSFGGESPLLSLLTYGAVALSLGGYFAPIILLLGMLIVLVNGMVVQRLSRRFTSSGGYYTYAMHSLSERTGFQTGWMYLYYSILFGSAYAIGTVYVINYVFGISPMIVALAITVPAFLFLMLGMRPSAKYAVFAGIIEIGVMVGFFIISVFLSHGSFYSPFAQTTTTHLPAGRLALAILFAMGIPTGYGSIAPISGEIVDAQKVVGKAAISVIIIGGLLAAVFVYGLTNVVLVHGVDIYTASGSGGLVVINLVKNYFGSLGNYLMLILAFGAINDGVLAVLSFSAAASRTVFKMGSDGVFPSIFSRQKNRQPIFANLGAGVSIILVSTLVLIPFQPATSFIALGTVSVFGGLFIHIAANFSLLRVGIRRGKRKLFGGIRSLKMTLAPFAEIILAAAAVAISSLDLIFSMLSTALIFVTMFLGWIVVGYLVADVRDIVFKAPPIREKKKAESVNSLRRKVSGITAKEIMKELPDFAVKKSDLLKDVLKTCLDQDSPGAIVLNSSLKPVGTILLRDIVELTEEELKMRHVKDYMLSEVATVKPTDEALSLAEVFRQSGLPILAIVGEQGGYLGTVTEREIIRRLASVQENYFLDIVENK
jgi:amino acid transporter/CBS domain-containing protein